MIVMGRGTFKKVIDFPEWSYDKKLFCIEQYNSKGPEALKNKVVIVPMKPAELLQHLSSQGFSAAYIDGGKVIQHFLNED